MASSTTTNMNESAIKTGVKTVAIGFILYKVAGYVVGALVCGIVSIVSLRKRWGWTSELRPIKSIECHDFEVKKCTGKTKRCRTKKRKSCQVRIEGINRVLQKTFNPTSVPQESDVLKVYFDPKRKDDTSTLNNFPSSMFGVVFAILCVIQIVNVISLLKFEKAVASA